MNKPTTTEKLENLMPLPEQGGRVSAEQVKQETSEKFKSIDTLIYAVVVAIVVSSVASLVSVGAIEIDQLHFNNQTYRSELESQKQNMEFLKEIENLKAEVKLLQQKK